MTSFVFVQSCPIFCETGHNKWQCNLQSAFESVCSTLFQICSKKSLFTYNTEMELSEMRHDMTSLPPFKQYHIWQQQKLFFQQIWLFPLVDRKSIFNIVYYKRQPDFGSKAKLFQVSNFFMNRFLSLSSFVNKKVGNQ